MDFTGAPVIDIDSPGQCETLGSDSITETVNEHLRPGKKLSVAGVTGQNPGGRRGSGQTHVLILSSGEKHCLWGRWAN